VGADLQPCHWACLADELRSQQPRSRLTLEHERPIGDVVALERNHARLWATATINNANPNLLASGEREQEL
jgi:hypothetical protein